MYQNENICIDFQQDIFQKEGEHEYEVCIPRRLLTKKVLLKYTNNKEAIYIIDGRIIRIDKIHDIKQKSQIITNLEQIKYLRWMGDYGTNLQKIGKWFAIWKGCNLDIGGYYSDDGKQQGMWKEILINFKNQVQVYEFGLYKDDFRQGFWKIIYDDQVIGGGSYDLHGKKIGQWLELHQQWEKDLREIIIKGEYRNGHKIGRWDTVDIAYSKQKVIGGGSYDQQGLKYGKWVDIHDLWDHFCSVTYHGEYKNGKKYGSWIIEEKDNQKIGGGSYQENGMKNGEWTEINAEWIPVRQINFKGVYKNGQKTGFWDTLKQRNTNIGGGQYNDNGLKDGKWTELHEEWQNWDREVTYQGEYFQGKKIGKWNTLLNGNQNIGGGQYNQDGLKSGRWVDLCDGWEGNSVNSMQFTYNGEYQKGKKIGRWDIIDKYEKLIGGGSYDENGMKNGKWVEQHEEWRYNFREITFHGEYKNGLKIGNWNIIQNGDKIVGGGLYDLNGIKDGKWIELNDSWDQEDSPITYNGEYQNGIKCGKWESVYDLNSIIGGGQYDEIGMKNGQWIELDQEWKNDSREISFKGEYIKSKKFGNWETIQVINGPSQIIKNIEYDDKGLRI